MATQTARFGERDRNLARPAIRRNPVECKNSNRGLNCPIVSSLNLIILLGIVMTV
jgi:hypothetical protein